MTLTPEECYRLDIAGFITRNGVLTETQIRDLRNQIDNKPLSVPAGAAAVMLEHPRIIEAVCEIVGAPPRVENVEVYNGTNARRDLGGLILGGPDPDVDLFDYRVIGGRPRCPAVRVVAELAPLDAASRSLTVLPGSHRVRVAARYDGPGLIDPGDPLFVSPGFPAGSVTLLVEGTVRAWRPGPRGREAVELVFVHPAVAYSRNIVRRSVLDALPRHLKGYFRDPWQFDFTTDPPTRNTMDRFLGQVGD